MSGSVEKRSRCNKANTANETNCFVPGNGKAKNSTAKLAPAKEISIRFELKRRLLMKERRLYYMPAQAAKQAA
jgi:hypothetical protein